MAERKHAMDTSDDAGYEDPVMEKAIAAESKDPKAAAKLYHEIIQRPDPKGQQSKLKEDAIYRLGKLLAREGLVAELKQLFVDIRPFFQTIPKSRTAKIVRELIDSVGADEKGGKGVSPEVQAEICQEAVAWCQAEKRTFLRQRIQAKLAALYLQMGKFKDALAVINRLVREVRKFDDKLLLVEIQLIESRVHHALQNVPKAKGALTGARAAANAIYCPPLLQAQIDLQAGILCAEEKDYKTAFSYFYEAFEGYNSMTPPQPQEAVRALKYMLLSKIMTNNPEDVTAIVTGKAGLKYAGEEIEAMRAVAEAHKKRSIHDFERVYEKYRKQLEDPVVAAHVSELKSNLLERNLLRIIEPFSRVEVAHIAKLIDLPLPLVEQRLSSMILDKKLNGILDAGAGVLIVFQPTESNKTYEATLETIKELNKVVDRLFVRAQKLIS